MPARAADHIRENLEQAILTGSYVDGLRLDELRLAEQFEVSRTPIREALQMLAATGLVDLIPRRGAFVRHPGFVELVEMFEVMAELECLCGRLAARRLTDTHLVDLRAAESGCVSALESGDTDAYYRANERFHNLLYQASGNGFLTGEANRLHKRLQPFRRLQLRVRGRMVQSMDEHKAILSALEAGDAETTGRLLRDHVAIQGEKFHDLMAGFHGQSEGQSLGQSDEKLNGRPVSRVAGQAV
ncbi:GntR family transcriptional regulator [Pararhizobium sp. IMCC21322]|uniref:GntR family transcriptional regulator n=1 Tax=Pararhizobium sp. IMCC21322 TaxID=3067903 RepID=UPI0027416A29|nr:GntR family transcriptional regulator [Pararhizobium sp. IMCC21322]